MGSWAIPVAAQLAERLDSRSTLFRVSPQHQAPPHGQ